jgi:hypothetical protein
MVEEVTKEFVLVLAYLLPGFLAAWVFYGLTSHSKPSQFERVVQAVIFTFVIQTLIPLCRAALEKIGQLAPMRPWDTAAEGLMSLVLALVFGVTLAHFTNTDSIHKRLRRMGFTTRTLHPSEWYCVLSEKVTFVVLHLVDGRRLYGWPKEWPIEPNRGQFYITGPCWIQADGSQIDLPQLDGILISVNDVRWVEFLKEGK